MTSRTALALATLALAATACAPDPVQPSTGMPQALIILPPPSDTGTDTPPPPPPPPAPVVTPGKTTGGGQIASSVTFGIEVRSDAKGIKGNCNVVDHAANVKVRCTDITFYAQTATHATFSGTADVDGVPATFTIDVDDLAESGRGFDTFKLVTSTGYTVAGPLTQGNVQVHPSK